MSSSTNPMAHLISQKTASPSLKRSSSKTSTRTWALKWSKKWPAKQPIKLAMARPLLPSLQKPSTAKVFAMSLPAPTRWRSSAASKKLLKRSPTDLKKLSKPIQDRKEIAQVATISANGDTEIGEIIAKAMERVGKDGTITVEEGKGFETTLDVVEGMNFDRGYLSAYFMTNAESQEASSKMPIVLIYEKKIAAMKEFLPILQAVAETGRPFSSSLKMSKAKRLQLSSSTAYALA